VEINKNLDKFYQACRLLLQTVKNSKKNIGLSHMIKQTKLKKKKLTKRPSFEFQDILDKVQMWLEAPTREKGIGILQQNPELLTDQPERMFSVLIDEAHQHGNEFFVRVLRTISEFFRVVRLEIGNNKTASKDELRRAVEYALDHTDFSVFTEGKRPAIFIA